MTKYIITALILLTIARGKAISQTAENTLIGIYNTGARFTLTRADFGAQTATELIADMVFAYDTVKVRSTVIDSSRSKGKDKYENRCNILSELATNKEYYKNKIVLMDLNKACDVTQTCLLAQKAGAKAFVFIHNSNSNGNIKLPKKGEFKDSIRIPVFVVGNENGRDISALIPSVAGIKPKAVALSLVKQDSVVVLNMEAQAAIDKAHITWVNNTSTENDYFIVEKQNPLTNTFEAFSTVNSLTGSGLEQYTLYDENPIDGDNTYRIKLKMLNGTEQYTPPQTVKFLSNTQIKIFPNPTEDVLNIALKGYEKQPLSIVIFDMQGKVIHSQSIEHVSSAALSIPLSDKAVAGQYMLLLKSKGKRDVMRTFMVSK